VVDDAILCVVCSERHGGRAGDCLTESPSPGGQGPRTSKPAGSAFEKFLAAMGDLDGRKVQAPLTTVQDQPPYGDLWCVRCYAEGKGNPVGWADPLVHQHDDE
jgi:hypothetical protein